MARRKQKQVSETGLVRMLHCTTCKSLRWSAGIPFVLLLSAAGFVVFAQVAEVAG